MKNKKGFTLVELLAVIVILAIILVIGVPQIMKIIESAKDSALEATAKLIAKSAEERKIENDTLGITTKIECSDIVKLSDNDYKDCTIDFNEHGKAIVNLVGKGKYEGKAICDGTAKESIVNQNCYTDESCFTYETKEGAILEIDINYTGCKSVFESELGSSVAETICTGGTYEGMNLKDAITTTEDPEVSAQQMVTMGVINSYEFIDLVTITGYDNTCEKNVKIPKKIDNKVVTEIGESAFYEKALTSVKFPNTITTIHSHAFGKNKLTSVSLPTSLELIWWHAFTDNQISGELDLSNNKISVVASAAAFSNNQITSVKFPKDITDIGEGMFINNNIKELNLSEYDKLTTISYDAFENNEIEKLILPDSLEVIDGSSFFNNKISDLLIPSRVVSIKSTAFSNNPFKSITLENTDTILENCAFGNISELETHNIPSTYVCND